MGSQSLTLKAVCNSTPIIILSQIGRLDFLNIFDELIIPGPVYEEVDIGGIPKDMDCVDYDIKSCQKSDAKFNGLDMGEASGLSIIMNSDDEYIFLTDDLETRRSAKEENIEVHGSIGLIVLAFSHEKIDFDPAKELIKEIQRKTDLFITDEMVDIGIEELERLSG